MKKRSLQIKIIGLVLIYFIVANGNICISDDSDNIDEGPSVKVVMGELGLGYVFSGAFLIAGTGVGQVVYPKTEEHAGGGLVGALMGFCVGGSTGVYIVGEKYDGDSTNDPLVFLTTIVGGLSIPTIGILIGERKVLTYGVLFSPVVSCITYNLVKKRENKAEENRYIPIFRFSFAF